MYLDKELFKSIEPDVDKIAEEMNERGIDWTVIHGQENAALIFRNWRVLDRYRYRLGNKDHQLCKAFLTTNDHELKYADQSGFLFFRDSGRHRENGDPAFWKVFSFDAVDELIDFLVETDNQLDKEAITFEVTTSARRAADPVDPGVYLEDENE